MLKKIVLLTSLIKISVAMGSAPHQLSLQDQLRLSQLPLDDEIIYFLLGRHSVAIASNLQATQPSPSNSHASTFAIRVQPAAQMRATPMRSSASPTQNLPQPSVQRRVQGLLQQLVPEKK